MMHCNVKVMAKVAAVLAGGFGVAWFTFPQFRELMVASAPLLFVLLCPLSMVAMMFMMRGQDGQNTCSAPAKPERKAEAQPEVAPAARVERPAPAPGGTEAA